jgi:hypothetical protein
MATVTVRNGIDVQALLETIEAIKTKPELAEFTFRASTSWQHGTASTAQIGAFVHAGDEDESRTEPFTLEGDEPPILLGHTRARTPSSCCWPRSVSAIRSATSPTPPRAGSRSSR